MTDDADRMMELASEADEACKSGLYAPIVRETADACVQLMQGLSISDRLFVIMLLMKRANPAYVADEVPLTRNQ